MVFAGDVGMVNLNILAETNGRKFVRTTIDRHTDFKSPFPAILFPCLIWDHDGRFPDNSRLAIARALLEAGCRYAVCGGQNCEAWHDAIDRQFIEAHLDDADEAKESAHVMTTWHDGESPDDVAFFFVHNTNFDDHNFSSYLVLHIGSGPTIEQIDDSVFKYAVGKKAD